MSHPVYLSATYQEKDEVSALGARFDIKLRQWYVPPGRSLAPFARWLPEQVRQTLATTAVDVVQGVSLIQLLARVRQAVANAFPTGEWVRVEVVRAELGRGGHIYLELAERDAQGHAVAQARGVIWADTARTLVAKFEQATGIVLGPNLKLLVRATPSFHPQYGLSLQVDDIDPHHTLGDLEARRREIRTRLQREGLFDRNRALTPPWDYRWVLVLAPESAAGLGDFMAEARRLERFALCRFEIVHSRFQGEGAAAEMREALLKALELCGRDDLPMPDAVVIIRGGGAVNDLAWLDDYALARCICGLNVPVLTGIGHERDNTVLDEVAHLRFDTPSKVIAGIEHTIATRAREAQQAFDSIRSTAERATAQWRDQVQRAQSEIRDGARRQISRAIEVARDRHDEVRHGARRSLVRARDSTQDQFDAIRGLAMAQIVQARQQTPQWMAEIRVEARQSLRTARQLCNTVLASIEDRTRSTLERERERTVAALVTVAQEARRTVHDARNRGEHLLREIVGQGPEKTMRRGFAVVRNEAGGTITSAHALRQVGEIEVQFCDGRVPATVRGDGESEGRHP